MNQVTFIVEIVVKDNESTFIVRSQVGRIVKISHLASDVTSFFEDVIDYAPVSNSTNSPNHD